MRGEYEFISPYWDDISQGAMDLIRQLLGPAQFLFHPFWGYCSSKRDLKSRPLKWSIQRSDWRRTEYWTTRGSAQVGNSRDRTCSARSRWSWPGQTCVRSRRYNKTYRTSSAKDFVPFSPEKKTEFLPKVQIQNCNIDPQKFFQKMTKRTFHNCSIDMHQLLYFQYWYSNSRLLFIFILFYLLQKHIFIKFVNKIWVSLKIIDSFF